jgi:hypothetical protein
LIEVSAALRLFRSAERQQRTPQNELLRGLLDVDERTRVGAEDVQHAVP